KKDKQKEPPFNGKSQVWKVALEDGKVTPMTEIGDGVTGYDYAPKAEVLAYSLDRPMTDDDDFSKIRAKFDKLEYGHGKRKVSQVHMLHLKNDNIPGGLIADGRYIRELA